MSLSCGRIGQATGCPGREKPKVREPVQVQGGNGAVGGRGDVTRSQPPPGLRSVVVIVNTMKPMVVFVVSLQLVWE